MIIVYRQYLNVENNLRTITVYTLYAGFWTQSSYDVLVVRVLRFQTKYIFSIHWLKLHMLVINNHYNDDDYNHVI